MSPTMTEYLNDSLSWACMKVFTVTIWLWLVMGIMCMARYLGGDKKAIGFGAWIRGMWNRKG